MGLAVSLSSIALGWLASEKKPEGDQSSFPVR